MGEAAACLLQSFSHPSESCLKADQKDPIKVLGESISFGRFMSESLAWEKWSSFSQNRYLEEVEKFSKPGSVAQKKAYFEAHYKKKALQRETNAQSAMVALEQAEEKSSPPEFITEKSGDIVFEDTAPEINLSDEKLESPIDASVGDSPVDESLGESSESKEEEGAAILQTAMEISESPNEISGIGGEERRLLRKKRPAVSPLKSGHQIGAALKIPPNPAKKADLRPRQMNNVLSNSMKSTDNVHEKSRLTATAKSLHSSINSPAGLRKPNEKGLAVSSRSSKPQIGASKPLSDPKANNGSSKIPKPGDNELGKWRLPATAKSLHASINLPSGLTKSNKSTSFSQTAARIGQQKDIPKQKTPLKAPENRNSKKSPAKTRPNDRRILSQSVSVFDRKLKSSARISTAPPTTVSSSFNFRIEERALKRKEFFQKLEEKAMAKKTELQTRYKNKTATNNEKRRQSTSAMAKPRENRPRRPPLPSNQVRKVAKNGLEFCNFSQGAKEGAKKYGSNSSHSVHPWRATTKSIGRTDSPEKTKRRDEIFLISMS